MKHFLWGLSLVLALVASASHAEIYKWKDKNGVIRYSDVPPPSNIPHESLGKKAGASKPDDAPVTPEAPPSPSSAVQQHTPEEVPADAGKQQKEEAAARQKAEAAEAELKQKQEQCSKAKARLNSYQQGGRIYKTNEKGEREYMDDAALAKGVEEAQAEVDKYCQ